MQSRKPLLIAGKSLADIFGVSVVVIMLAVMTFERDSYRIGIDSPDVIWLKKTWWGLKNEQRPVKWSNGAWRVKSKSGEWYSFLRDNDSEPPENVPVR